MEKKKYVAPQTEVINMEMGCILALSIDKGEGGPNIPEAPKMEFFDDEDLSEEDMDDVSYY